jgi:PQQ-dependent catabolism-associated beta-propeller protein
MTRRVRLFFILWIVILSACREQQPPVQNKKSAEPPKPGAYRVYVTNERSGDLTIIDSANNEVVATVSLGKRPRGIHASLDGKTIYVALSGSPIVGPGIDESKLPPPDKKADGIGVFDVGTNKLVKVIASGSDPEEFDLSKDGKLIYISNEDAAAASIVDLARGKVLNTLKVGEGPEGVATSPDGKLVYVTSEDQGTISVIDTAAAKVIKTFEVGHRPRHTAFFPDMSKAYITCENDGMLAIADATQHKKIGEIEIGTPGQIKPMSVILSKDTRTAYVSSGRGKKVFIIDTATDKATSSIEVGDRPWGMALSPDNKFLYTANGPSNDVSVVDLATQTVVKRVKTGESPWGVLVIGR